MERYSCQYLSRFDNARSSSTTLQDAKNAAKNHECSLRLRSHSRTKKQYGCYHTDTAVTVPFHPTNEFAGVSVEVTFAGPSSCRRLRDEPPVVFARHCSRSSGEIDYEQNGNLNCLNKRRALMLKKMNFLVGITTNEGSLNCSLRQVCWRLQEAPLQLRTWALSSNGPRHP